MFNLGQICRNSEAKYFKASLSSSTGALFSDKARFFSQSEHALSGNFIIICNVLDFLGIFLGIAQKLTGSDSHFQNSFCILLFSFKHLMIDQWEFEFLSEPRFISLKILAETEYTCKEVSCWTSVLFNTVVNFITWKKEN